LTYTSYFTDFSPAMNYFNYFTEIEDAFVRRRGKHLFLSPIDWALMETWKQAGIPLHIVLRGIERAFDSHEAKKRKRSIKSLLYCQEEVEAQFAEWVESRVGANSNSTDAIDVNKTPFTPTRIREHLHESQNIIQHLGSTRARSEADSFSEALTRASELLKDLQNDFETDGDLNTRKLEDSLTGLERMLNDALLASVPVKTLETIRKELKAQFKPYKSHMDPQVYKQTLDNLLLKRLREHYGVPRLSLFYL
jgi:hypothetical protein